MTSSSDDLDIAGLLTAIKRKRAWLIGLPLIGGLLTFIALGFVTPQYTSEARLLIDNKETAYTRPAVGDRRAEPLSVDKAVVASQVQVITSRDLAGKIIAQLGLDKKSEFNKFIESKGLKEQILSMFGSKKTPSKSEVDDSVSTAFADNLSVYPVEESHVININFRSSDPILAADVANMLADEYVTWQREAKLNVNKGASKWLSSQIDALRKKVQDAEARAEKFRTKTGQRSGENASNLSEQQLSELNSQLIKAKAQRSEIEARAKLIDKMLRNNENLNAAPDVVRSPLIQRLLEQKTTVLRTRAELSATLLPRHPRFKQLNAELTGIQKQIRFEISKIAKALNNEASIARSREKALLESLDTLKNVSADASEDTIQLRALQREAKANRDLLESYLARYRDASSRRDSDSVPASATIVSRAYPSSVPAFPRKLPMTILAMGAIFLLTFSYVISSALLSNTAKAETSKDHNLPRVVDVTEPHFSETFPGGSIFDDEPVNYPSGPARYLEAAPSEAVKLETIENVSDEDIPGSKGAVICESIEDMSAHLKSCAEDEPGYRVLFAGSNDRVETSATIVKLARTLAKSGTKIVIVDASEGTRSVSGELGITRAPGLCELVNKEASFEEVIHHDPESTVRVISSGNPQRGDPSQNLTEILSRILDGLDSSYDIVFLHGGFKTARQIFQALDADFDAGIVVTRTGEAQNLANLKERNFLDFTVSGLEIILFESLQISGRRASGPKALPSRASGMTG